MPRLPQRCGPTRVPPSPPPASGRRPTQPPGDRRRSDTACAGSNVSRSYAVRRQPALDLGAIRVERLRACRFETHDQYGLRVRGAQQSPPFRERDAHAVERRDGILRGKLLRRLLDDVELLLVGTVDAYFGRGVGFREVGEEA